MVLSEHDVVLRVPLGSEGGTYVFRCPGCARPSVHEASPAVVEVLTAAGVALQRWRTPAEVLEEHPSGAPFSLDDLLDFHELLQDDAKLRALLGGLTSS